MMVTPVLGLGIFAREQQREIGAYAIGTCDRALMSIQFAREAELAFQHYADARRASGAGAADPVTWARLAETLRDLDLAIERAGSVEAAAAGRAVRRAIAALGDTSTPGPDLERQLASAGAALHDMIMQSWSAALRSRDAMAAFAARANDLLLVSTVCTMIFALGLSTMLDRAWRQRQSSAAKMAHMARHDLLTGLPNRAAFQDEVDTALCQTQSSGGCALLCIDIDLSKLMKEALGHPVGDALLKTVAVRLRATVRAADAVARLSHAFAVLTTSVEQPGTAAALASRLLTALTAPYEIEGHHLVVSASIGVALSTPGIGVDAFMRNGDLALYQARQEARQDGRGVFRFFEPSMDAAAQARLAMEQDLHAALERGEFEVYYQPLISVSKQSVSMFEALVRWNHPVRGLQAPDSFIPLAEEIGLMADIDDFVLRSACLEAAGWPDNIGVAVNLSAAQFGSGTLLQQVRHALDASGLAAERLELEVTERMLLEDSVTTLATMHELRALGVRISMDDFGTGYSSLSYLRSFPFDKLKIDRSFISDGARMSENIVIVRAIASMGRALGIATLAEGVETREQMEHLVAQGCAELQGYFFSKPCRASDIPALLGQVARQGKWQKAVLF
jgi:diguanylate cyclase (GGDEF)-like protein